MKKGILLPLLIAMTGILFAGNPDRQGEAGAYELLLNPWARSAGLHTMTTSFVSGVEAMRLNIAGLSRINKTEIVLGHTILYNGTDISLNSIGLSQRVGKSGAFGLTITTMDFGDIPVTTTDLPEGTGATFSPNFFNLGLGYSTTFENKVSVGILIRGISESIADLAAFGFAVDAGVQYVTGPQDNFKFGISLRNIGSPMRFGGEGLSFQTANPGDATYNITVDQRAENFELPSMLNIGVSYDLIFLQRNRLTFVGNFTANSFARDQIGGGLEYGFNEMFIARVGYKIDMGEQESGEADNVYSGLSAGVTIEVPFKKESASRFAVDYAYRTTQPFDGTHNFSLRIKI